MLFCGGLFQVSFGHSRCFLETLQLTVTYSLLNPSWIIIWFSFHWIAKVWIAKFETPLRNLCYNFQLYPNIISLLPCMNNVSSTSIRHPLFIHGKINMKNELIRTWHFWHSFNFKTTHCNIDCANSNVLVKVHQNLTSLFIG